MRVKFSDPDTEYASIIHLLDENQISKGDAYSQLMQKEKNALETINRVVDHEQDKKIQNSLFFNQSILSNLALFSNTWKVIIGEMMMVTHARDLKDILYRPDRKIYVGMMLFVIAFFIMMVEII
jgi:hypothetical protein